MAPTSSTTLTLAYGDDAAIALMRERDFKPDHFSRFHPGGALGRKLLVKMDHRKRTENFTLHKIRKWICRNHTVYKSGTVRFGFGKGERKN